MLDWLARLFERPEEPVPECELAALGQVHWSEDDEAWRGCFNGISYLLSYEGRVTPAEDLIAYAFRMLDDKEAFLAAIHAAKLAGLAEYPLFYSDEISGLSLGLVYFFRNKQQFRILADLDGGLDCRAWRVEFLGDHCEGIGFDS